MRVARSHGLHLSLLLKIGFVPHYYDRTVVVGQGARIGEPVLELVVCLTTAQRSDGDLKRGSATRTYSHVGMVKTVMAPGYVVH